MVRVVAVDHPLRGRAAQARRVYRQWGRLWLVLGLPDGGVVSVEVADTDVLEAVPVASVQSGTGTLSVEGARRLLGLLEAWMSRAAETDAAVAAGEGEPR